jgi:hypothetical protein
MHMSEGADSTPGTTAEPLPHATGATAYGAATAPLPTAPPVPTDSTDSTESKDSTHSTVSTAPEYSASPVAFRRSDIAAGLLLVLAGVAAGISLLLPWLADRDDSGLELVWRGFDEIGDLGDSGFWQPLAVVLGGGVLLVLGLLLLVPARSHRFLGAVALVVTALAAAGVLVPLAQDGWRFGGFAVGFWFAIAVPVLGLLGSLKALLTGPTYGTHTPAHRG